MTHKFNDAAGRTWALSLHVGIFEDVQKATGLNLDDFAKDNLKMLATLSNNPRLLVRVLYVALKEQADAEKITPEQFGGAMRGDALPEALDAFADAMVDFYPTRIADPMRAILKKYRDTANECVAGARERITDGLSKIDSKELATSILDQHAAEAAAETQQQQSVDNQ